jgi:hypothetical protein
MFPHSTNTQGESNVTEGKTYKSIGIMPRLMNDPNRDITTEPLRVIKTGVTSTITNTDGSIITLTNQAQTTGKSIPGLSGQGVYYGNQLVGVIQSGCDIPGLNRTGTVSFTPVTTKETEVLIEAAKQLAAKFN